MEGPSAVLSSTVPRPAGSAAPVQAIYADDYRGKAVTFSGEISGDFLAGRPGLRVEILRHWWRGAGTREDHGFTIVGRRPGWTGHEITAQIPADADLIRFGIALNGPGRKRCATRTCASSVRTQERRECGRLRRRPGEAGPRR